MTKVPKADYFSRILLFIIFSIIAFLFFKGALDKIHSNSVGISVFLLLFSFFILAIGFFILITDEEKK